MPYEITREGKSVHIAVTAKEMKQAFLDGGRAFLHLLSGDKAVHEQEKAEIVIQAATLHELYRAWLDEIMLQSSAREILFSDLSIFVIEKTGKDFVLTGSAVGERIPKSDPRYASFPVPPIKATCVEKNGFTCDIHVKTP